METKKTKIQLRREQLKIITKKAKEMHDEAETLAEYERNTTLVIRLAGMTVNQMIWTYIYNKEILKSFNNWRKLGFSIKKGSKAKLLWGQPLDIEKVKANDEIEEYEFYPVAFVFSEKDVVKHKKAKT